MLTPNDFVDLAEVERRLLEFERRYEVAAKPFEWRTLTCGDALVTLPFR